MKILEHDNQTNESAISEDNDTNRISRKASKEETKSEINCKKTGAAEVAVNKTH
ncbi:MAG: hypothetical protein K1X85_02170 [Ignavibacteria bacterium]|nr:hypothetical protein [Ignavibacteria bacterium]